MLTLLCFAIAFLWLCGVVLYTATGHRQEQQYMTFGTMWASGRAAASGLNPYADYPQTQHPKVSKYEMPASSYPDLNLNPPWTLPFIQTLAYLPIERFQQVWTLLNGLCLLVGCIILIHQQPELQGRQILWLVTCAPTLETFDWGQLYTGPFLIGVLAWMFNKNGKHLPAGIAIGTVVALRPTMAIWLLILYLAKHRESLIAAIGTILTLYVLPLLIYGPRIYTEWSHAFDNDQHWLEPVNIAIMPLAARHGHAIWGIAAAASIMLGVCVWAIRTRPDFSTSSGAGLCLGIACSPLAWFLYLLFVAPFFMTRRWSMLAMSGAALFLVRHQILPTTRGILYLIGTLMILAFFIQRPSFIGHETP